MTHELNATPPVLGWARTARGPGLDRRRLLGWATGIGATAAIARITPSVALPATVTRQASAPPSSTHTWLLDSPDALRPDAPGAPTRTEQNELLDLQAGRTDATVELIDRWGGRVAVLPWTDVAHDGYVEFDLSPVMCSRAGALLQTAMHDAAIAALDAQVAHGRPGPAATDDAIEPAAGVDPTRPSFPSEHAAVAGAAAAVLAYVFADAAPGRFDALAQEAAESRLAAGAAFRSDIEAGLALGQAVGALAVARGTSDGSDAEWDGSTGRLSGEGYWEPTPPDFPETPALPLAGTWQTWILPGGDAIRPGPPPEFGTPARTAQLAAVRSACDGRTFAQEQAAHYWNGTTSFQVAPQIWTDLAADLIVRHGLDLTDAARALSLANAAMYDAFVACWDAKYTYWMARPITDDPTLKLLFGTPPHPSYPSGHATVSGAAAATLAALFPSDEADLLNMAEEAAASRCWAGIHFPYDDDIGLAMGHTIGYLAADLARSGGGDDAG